VIRSGEFEMILSMGASTIAVIAEMTRQIKALEAELNESFESHPDADIITSLPGLGPILGARVLGEFGDDPNRCQDARSRKTYAGTAPLTRASGTKKVVLARFVRNRHLGDATYLWAFASLSSSPGARAYYDSLRAKGDGHNCALRALSNHLVGILHGCLAHREAYDETKAWGHQAGNAPDGAARAA
jgi:transposase